MLEDLLATHPLAKRRFDELASAAREAAICALACTACADACLAEEGDVRQSVRLNLDCADVCGATAREAVRLTGYDQDLRRRSLELCVRACELCAEECERHQHEHCRLCAAQCRRTVDACRAALESI